ERVVHRPGPRRALGLLDRLGRRVVPRNWDGPERGRDQQDALLWPCPPRCPQRPGHRDRQPWPQWLGRGASHSGPVPLRSPSAPSTTFRTSRTSTTSTNLHQRGGGGRVGFGTALALQSGGSH